MKKTTFSLTEKEVKLLFIFLEELACKRSRMGCNDPEPIEEKLFTKNELKQMSKAVGNPKECFDSNFLFNFQYVDFLLEKLKQQFSSN